MLFVIKLQIFVKIHTLETVIKELKFWQEFVSYILNVIRSTTNLKEFVSSK